jgi:hypothetical protein
MVGLGLLSVMAKKKNKEIMCKMVVLSNKWFFVSTFASRLKWSVYSQKWANGVRV